MSLFTLIGSLLVLIGTVITGLSALPPRGILSYERVRRAHAQIIKDIAKLKASNYENRDPEFRKQKIQEAEAEEKEKLLELSGKIDADAGKEQRIVTRRLVTGVMIIGIGTLAQNIIPLSEALCALLDT